jgi:DNA adenine methylase
MRTLTKLATALRTLDQSDSESVQHVALLPGLSTERLSARPFVRWAGGKTRLLSAILPHLPDRFAIYHEPFLGSGAVFFAIRSRPAKHFFLSDLNEDLINVWTVVRDRPQDFYRALKKYVGKDSERDYYEIRDGALPRVTITRAARFFYLNQTAWNGLWRVNRWGVFNVPWGNRPFRCIDQDTLKNVSTALRGISIEAADVRDSLKRATAGDLVYLDPPYLPISDTSKFSGYTERRFRVHDLVELSDHCRELTKKGVHWVLSNRDNPMMREIFSHAKIVSFTTRRSVAAQNRRNIQPKESPEVIIIGGPPS